MSTAWLSSPASAPSVTLQPSSHCGKRDVRASWASGRPREGLDFPLGSYSPPPSPRWLGSISERDYPQHGPAKLPASGQEGVLDPPTKVWNRPFHTPGAECTEPPGELGLTVPPRGMCQQVVSQGLPSLPPPSLTCLPRASCPTNYQGWLQLYNADFFVCFFGEGCSEKQNALGLARWLSHKLMMPASSRALCL